MATTTQVPALGRVATSGSRAEPDRSWRVAVVLGGCNAGCEEMRVVKTNPHERRGLAVSEAARSFDLSPEGVDTLAVAK